MVGIELCYDAVLTAFSLRILKWDWSLLSSKRWSIMDSWRLCSCVPLNWKLHVSNVIRELEVWLFSFWHLR